MLKLKVSLILSLWSMLIIIPLAHSTDIAIIDFADQWTQVAAVGTSLEEYGYKYDDITKEVEKGNLNLDGYKFLFMSSMFTNNATLHQSVDKNEGVIHEFVEKGGVVIEPTQADQNEANVDWLPDNLICVRSDPDPAIFEIKDPDHSVFNNPNKFREDDFLGWTYQGWPTGWEVIASQSGFDVLMVEKGTNKPIIMEAKSGKGYYVLMCLGPDKYHVKGNDDKTKEGAGRLIENIMETWYNSSDSSTPVQSQDKITITWGKIRTK